MLREGLLLGVIDRLIEIDTEINYEELEVVDGDGGHDDRGEELEDVFDLEARAMMHSLEAAVSH